MDPPCTRFRDSGAPPNSSCPSPSSSSTTAATARSKNSAVTSISRRCPGCGCRISIFAASPPPKASRPSASNAARTSMPRCSRYSRRMRRCCSRSRSNERTYRIRTVPADAGAIEFAEQRLERLAEFDEFDVTRQHGGRVHVGHMTAARHSGEKYQCMPLGLILRYVALEVRGRAPPVMKAVAAAIDPLFIYGWCIVVGLDEFDVHVACEAHRQRNVRRRIAAPILGVGAREVIEQEPRTHFEFVDPCIHGCLNIGNHITHLNDAIVGLTKAYESHRFTSCFNPRPRASNRRRSIFAGP